MRPSTVCLVYGAYLTAVSIAILVEPVSVINAINSKVGSRWSLDPLPPADTEQGAMLYLITSIVGLVYFLNGIVGNEVFAMNSIFARLAVAAGLAVLIQQRVVGNGWNILVAQETSTALISVYFSFSMKQSRGMKRQG